MNLLERSPVPTREPALSNSSRARTAWLVFALLLLCSGYFFPRWADWNVNSRLDLTLAIVDQGRLSIDDYYQNTGDYAFFNGHHYSDKAPGTSLLAVPVYWAYKAIGVPALVQALAPRLTANPALTSSLNPEGRGLLADSLKYFAALLLVTFITTAIPAAALGALFYRFLGYFSNNEFHKVALALTFGLATPAFAYSNNMYGHQLVAGCLFAAFVLLFGLRWSEQRALRLALAGFLMGFSLLTEYPTALIVGGLGLYALWRERDWRNLAWGFVGGIPPLIVLAVYNYAIFGSPLPVGYWYSPNYTELHHTGLISLTYPHWDWLVGVAVSRYRGLFFVSPFLLLSLPGFYFFFRDRALRAEFWL